MTTWALVADQGTSFEFPTDIEDGYVVASYVQNDYILPERIWTPSSPESTVWA